ncbi:hypothetical protein C3B59_06520 [Cryobacterium zongtaii]|uniref:DUF4082 domain-containing protein n=1 Tax=Cryobacterium zongtaii TaxID=1259217 RepID=A0A2S3ZJV9_9MICO|nr:hypothetical protein C3B59_06520 [Cryobacterium zongtaii]
MPAVDGRAGSSTFFPGFGSLAAKALATAVVVVSGLFIPLGALPANAAGCGTAPNPIVCENALPGTAASVWDISGAGDPSIQGFSTDISTNVGGTVGFKIDTSARAYTIAIYRTGWYQGNGARKIADVTPTAALPQNQPQCITEAATEFYDCGNWALSASWPVPADAVSGVYIALLTRTDTGGQSHITFVVRDQASTSEVLFQTSDPTWQAYNTYGGSDFYQGADNGRAYKVSYNRPVATRGGIDGRDFYFSNEYPAVRFLEKNGYDVSYFSGVDTDRFGASLKNHEVFLSVGHDEYWSGAQRKNVEAARDAGVNLQFLSGNEVYWRTRYEPSADSSATAYRTLVSYKETWSQRKIDPSAEWTGTWRDPRFASSANGGGLPENGLTGTQYQSNYSDLPVTVSAAEGKTRLWRNTGLSSLAAGTSAALAPHTVGYESNEDIDNGFRPAGLIRLSTTTGSVPEYLTDFGNTVRQGTTTHHVTLYKAPSGALVFSAGSVQWTWGLDREHDGPGAPADVRMQQAQVNLLADMGATPATLAAGLVATTASTDTTAPSVTVTSPAAGTSVPNGASTTISGTATDSGGVVAGVEVSTDGGTSWSAATGTSNWSYTYVQHGVATQSIRIRAIDDSANYPTTPTTLAVTVTGPHSVFGAQAPATPDSQDPSAVELGLRVTPTENGTIDGIRFYKSTANTGTHTGSLWSSTGTRLATATFTNETASGWQTATFATPVTVTAGTTYVASYWAPRGRYSADDDPWAYRGVTRAPLAVAGGFGAQPASVYNTNGDFPTDIYGQSNYYVDAVFTRSGNTAPSATAQSPGPGSSSVALNTAISATISTDVVASSVAFTVRNAQGTAVAGSTSYTAATRVATFTPASALAEATTYTVTLAARDAAGAALSSGGTWSFTTVQAAPGSGCPCSLYDDSTTPSVVSVADNQAVTLGVRFSAQTAGQITGIKFYKGPANTGSHTGTLWASDGTVLASGTFTAESTSGWQTLVFASPVSIQAATEYVAGYRTTVGQYSATPGQYSAAYTRGPLSAGVNAGTFSYAAGFPTNQTSTDYLVDVVFTGGGAAAVAVSSTTPAAGATGVAATATVSATLTAAPASGTPSLAVSDETGAVAGASTYNATTRVVTFTPVAALPAGTAHTAVVSLAGTALPNGSWSFTTAAAPGTGTSYSLLGNLTPAEAASPDDTSPVELGMSFSSAESGSVTAIRFYKGSTNTGTHTGSLWSSTGQRLATVTFTNETASGWQTAQLATPVALTAGQTYVVSYFAPNGRYASTIDFFSTARTVGPLTAGTANNGRYLYASAGGFPENTWQAANYFVDVVFSTSTTTPPAAVTVSSTTPAAGATNVAVSGAVSATLSAAPASGTPTLALSRAGTSVAGTSAYNATTRVVTFTPAAALAASTSYSAAVTLAGAAVSGGAWSFTTAAAPAAVTVSSTTPAAGATNVAVSGAVSATLSAAPASGTPTLALSRAGTSVAGTSAYNATTRVVTFTPAAALAASTSYSAAVTLAGAAVSGGAWSFTTAAAPAAVTVSSTTPAAGATNVAVSGAVSATLSAAPASGTPTLALSRAGTSVAGTSAYNATTRVVTFTPAAALAASTSYSAAVTLAGAAVSGGAWSFTTAAAPAAVTVSSTTPAAGATNVAVSGAVSATLSAAPASGTPTLALSRAGTSVAGTSAYNATTRVVTFTPAAALAASTSYSAAVTLAGAAVSGGAWSFTTAGAPTGNTFSLLDGVTPTVLADPDTVPTEVGMSFSTSAAGSVTAIRFYKGSTNTGTHTGSLWSSTGQRLATVTFTNETASGWQTAQLATPVALTAGQTYVVSYFAPNGRYSATPNYFATARTVGPLTAGTTSNGRYLYGAAGGFPTNSWQAENYFVDVVFSTSTTTPPAAVTVSSTTPAAGATNVAVSGAVSATLSAAPASGTPTLALSRAGTSVAGTSAYNATTRVVTFTPAAALAASTSYSAAVTLAGAAVSGGAWSFTTAGTPTGNTFSLLDGVTPTVLADPDTVPTEVGMSFSTSAAGSVTAIRFYKGSANTGTHTGSLWSSTGQRLATVTFTNETASGWQTAQLATPVVLTAGQTYVVSYFAPNGRYSATPNYFATARTIGPLTAGTTSNGRYLYGAAGGFPTNSWQAENYFVDVVFTRSG